MDDIVIDPKQENTQTIAGSDKKVETEGENTGWIIGLITLCSAVIAGVIAWMLWKKTKSGKR